MSARDPTEEPAEFLSWNGHRVFVQAAGRGEALLLIHGFPTSSRDWHHIAPALETR